MAVFPKARYVPTRYGGRTPRNHQGRGILHVAVSGRASLPPWNGNTWHMYVAKDGSCEQYVDSDFQAYASADANDDAFSIETEGGLGSSAEVNSEPWTPEQVETLAEIMVWLKRVDGTPLEVLPDSRPGRRGWGPHRLGIDPWRVPGGERWSSHYGKECPGDRKVAQIPQIVALARRLDSGQTEKEWWEMPIPDAEIDRIAQRTRVVMRDEDKVYGLAAIRAAVDRVGGLVVAADKGDDPQALADALVPLLAPRLAGGIQAELGGMDEKQAAAIAEGALRRVLGSLDEPA